MTAHSDFRPLPASPQFVTTRWGTVLAAAGGASVHAADALEQLCHAYWYPLYAYVRRRGYGPEDAQDLTQGFFARVLQKNYLMQADPARGRFRSFLLLLLNHFLADEWGREHAKKRGGGQPLFSLDAAAAEGRYQLEPVDAASPESLFERRWALTLLEQTLERLRQEAVADGKATHFDQFQPFLLGDPEPGDYAQAATRLGLSEGAARTAVHRLRTRFRLLFREQISQTVATPGEVEEEIAHLKRVLART